jgi:hypothetical protein
MLRCDGERWDVRRGGFPWRRGWFAEEGVIEPELKAGGLGIRWADKSSEEGDGMVE